MDDPIPLSVPNLGGNELKYVTEAIQTEWVSTAGPYVVDFESALSGYVATKGAVACQSGTAGLHIALLLCGVEAGDIVLVPTLTFVAAVNPVRYLNATPVFFDCDDSLCIDPEKLQEYCERECIFENGVLRQKATGCTVRAVVVVHVFGNMADMEKIMSIAATYNLKVVEDATEALGTRYERGPLSQKYAGTIGDVGVYSFNGNKIITTGGGGAVVSNNSKTLEKARHLVTQAKTDTLYYEHDEVGYNYRITNLQAALGVAQMEQLESFIDLKNSHYLYYAELLAGSDKCRLLPFRDGIRSNRWFYSLLLSDSIERDRLIKRLISRGIQTRPIWGLIHQQKPYCLEESYRIERAAMYRDCVVNLPCSTNLRPDEIERVVTAVLEELNS